MIRFGNKMPHPERSHEPNNLKSRFLFSFDSYMLGEQYVESTGKITSQRVLDIEGPIVETSVAANGTIKGTPVQVMLTFTSTPTAEKGVIHGMGKGIITTTGGGGEPEMVAYTGEGIGRFDSSGGIKWRGSVFTRKQYYSKTSGPSSSQEEGKLSFLNNMVGIFESEIDTAGNFSEKIWEWK
jgi:hypothetical protein